MSSRPSRHLAPTTGWLNDPNGMTWHEGRWHVFYQHNPQGPVHDAITWGHCSSADLVTWREHPVAFAPTPGGPDAYGCWSGVFVPSLNRPAVVYSGVVDDSLHSTVCLRWGSDDLDTWSDPVVVATTPEADGVVVMRDPFVLTRGGRRWALLGARLTGDVPAVLLYSCDDVLDWRYEGVWVTGADPVAGRCGPADIWECPQLVAEPGSDDAVLLLSLQLGGVLDRVEAVRGHLGTDDEGRPTFAASGVMAVDGGDALYAPQVARDPHGWWFLGWVREDAAPDGARDHAGCLTYPRRWTPTGWRLAPQLADIPAFTETDGPVHVTAPRVVRARGPWSLRGDTLAARGDAADVWLDGDVVEVYPHDGSTPSTYRDPGCAAWTITSTAPLAAAPHP